MGKTPHKASPERGGARRRRAEGFVSRSPTPYVHGGSVSRRDHSQLTGTRAHSQAEPSKKNRPTRTPAALRERGSGGEGKDSHSRQWRLSMAVFLNRNKRPQAAPIEVAELLSEKPPLPQHPRPQNVSSRGGAGESASLQRSTLPRKHASLTFSRFWRGPRGLGNGRLRRRRIGGRRCEWARRDWALRLNAHCGGSSWQRPSS